MSMSKRLQIPVTEQECTAFQAAARRAGLPLSEWARRQLRQTANESMAGSPVTPKGALDLIRSLEAPVGAVESMIEESLRGRYP